MKTTNVLAKEAIAHSLRKHIPRKIALKELLQREPLERPKWMSLEEARKRRRKLFECVLGLIPSFEPTKINAYYLGKIRGSQSRLDRLRKAKQNGRSTVPFRHPSDVAVEILRRDRLF